MSNPTDINYAGKMVGNGSLEKQTLPEQNSKSESETKDQAKKHESEDGIGSPEKPKLKKVNRDKYRKHGSDKKNEERDKKSSRKLDRHHSRSRSRSPRRHHSRSPRRRKEDRRSGSKHRSPGREKQRMGSRSKERSSKHRRRSRPRSRTPPSRSRRRSRSRSRRRRSRSKKRLSRSRRSRSSSKRRSRRSSSSSPYRFGFDKAMDAQERLARRLERAKELTRQKKVEEAKIIAEKGLMHLQGEELREAIEKAAKMIVNSAQPTAPRSSSTSELAAAQMTALKQQAEAETGISVPSYYNPLVVNPLQYAQQEAKRKKLWSKKESSKENSEKSESKADVETVWSKMSLGNNKSDEKFAKLMGIKQTNQEKREIDENDEVVKKQQELMTNLDMQYQQARVVTHTQRGMGLGFSAGLLNPNAMSAQQANQQLGNNNGPAPST